MPELGYLCGNGIELVTCKQSTISYPLHNHVSVFTIGFIMEGVITYENKARKAGTGVVKWRVWNTSS